MSNVAGGTRTRLLVLLAAVTAIGSITLNIYLPSLPNVQADFGVSVAQVQVTVSFAMLAFGLSLVLLGPLSDHFGRRPVILAGLAIFVVGALIGVLATSLLMLTIGRVVQSAGAAVAFIVARAVVADVSPRELLQRSVAQMTMIMLLAQMLAPLAGGFIMLAGGWRAIQLFLVVLGLVMPVLVWRGLPETRPAAGRSAVSPVTLYAPSLALLRRGQVLRHLLQFGLLCATFPAFISIAPHLMIDAFHRTPTEYGMYFVLLPVGYFAGNYLVTHAGDVYPPRQFVISGCLIGLVASAVGWLLLAGGIWHPLALFLPMGVLNLGLGLALPAFSTRAIEESRPNTASGWSLVGFSQQCVSAVSVQLLAVLDPDSPFPVLGLCVAVAVIVLCIELVSAAPVTGLR